MKYLYIVILLIGCIGLLACSRVTDWNCKGHYIGSGMDLWLNSDSSVKLNVRYSPNGYGANGKWKDEGKLIVISFPHDTAIHDPMDATHSLIDNFEMTTIVLEKQKPGNLIWRNRGVLINDNSKHRHNDR